MLFPTITERVRALVNCWINEFRQVTASYGKFRQVQTSSQTSSDKFRWVRRDVVCFYFIFVNLILYSRVASRYIYVHSIGKPKL